MLFEKCTAAANTKRWCMGSEVNGFCGHDIHFNFHEQHQLISIDINRPNFHDFANLTDAHEPYATYISGVHSNNIYVRFINIIALANLAKLNNDTGCANDCFANNRISNDRLSNTDLAN